MNPGRHLTAVLTALALALTTAAVLVAASPARAIDQSKGYAGFCKDSTGVTVVVDFGKLGGQTIVRCFPSAKRGTGLDALKGAGFQIAGVQRWGESFICRVENRPSATEQLPVKGNEGYKERCVDTPPAGAYWSYWHAGNNCAWEYSQWGVKNRDFIQGGFEGWSFSLNAKPDENPKPRIAAVRPGTEGGACNAPDVPGPSSNNPDETAPGASTPSATATPEGNSAEGALPPPKPRQETTPDDPDDNVEFTGGEQAANVNDTLREQSNASRYAPWAAGGVLILLGVTMWWTARRRQRARDA